MGSRAAAVAVAVLLLLAVGAGIWYLALGGRELIESTVLGGKEAVEVELAFTYTPVTASPLRDVEVDISVSARRVRVRPGIEFKKPVVKEGEDNIGRAAPGAKVYFRKVITIYDEEGNLLFNRTMEFTKGTDKTITIYISADEVRGDKLLIVVDIYIRVELPTPRGAPAPSAIEVSIHREVETNIQR